MSTASIQWIKKFLKETFLIGLIICLPVYAWVRLIFFEVPFSFAEDLTTLAKVMLTGWWLMIALKGSFYLILAFAETVKQRRLGMLVRSKYVIGFFVVGFLCTVLYACNAR